MKTIKLAGTIEGKADLPTPERYRAFRHADWVVKPNNLYLHFSHCRYDLQLKLMLYGFGATTVCLSDRCFTFFADGAITTAEGSIPPAGDGYRLYPKAEPLPEAPFELGYLQVVALPDGPILMNHTITQRCWTFAADLNRLCTCAPNKAEQPFLEILEAEFGTQCQLREVETPPQKIAGVIEPPFRTSEETETVHPEQPSVQGPTVTDPTPDTDLGSLWLDGPNGAKVHFCVPFELNDPQRRALELLAKYGHLSEVNLSKQLAWRRIRPMLESLIGRLYACGKPVIVHKGDAEEQGRLYGFDYQALEQAAMR